MQIFIADGTNGTNGTNGPTEGSTRGPRGPKKGKEKMGHICLRTPTPLTVSLTVKYLFFTPSLKKVNKKSPSYH